MHLSAIEADSERIQKRWIIAALLLALGFHLVMAWLLGWYKIPGLETPSHFTKPTGPFTVKRIEINPDALNKVEQDNPIAKLPVAEPPKNPAQFNLDPNLVEKALQAPLPTLSAPAVPEPNKVIGATEMSQGLPFVESDTAKISAEISKVEPNAITSGPLTSSKLAQDLITANAGTAQPGPSAGTPAAGTGTSKLPGFAELAPGFRATGPSVSNLPEPILLRLPSDVLFDFNSAKLRPEADGLLGQAVAMITKYPQADIQIDGYSDSFGQPDYNRDLSQQRAQAVQAWLQDRISQDGYKFHAMGHGSTDYVVSTQGTTIEQQQPNRRVELLIQALKP